MMRAAERGNVGAMRAALADGANIHDTDGCGRTPLIIAAERGHPAAVRALVELGADVNETVTLTGGGVWSGITPLLAACGDSTGTTPVVRTLVELGARLDATDSLGRTARDYAQIQEFSEILTLLDSVGAPRGLPKELLD